MIEIEDALIQGLSEGNEVDGHDAGSGEMNIFIRVDDPGKGSERERGRKGVGPKYLHCVELSGERHQLL